MPDVRMLEDDCFFYAGVLQRTELFSKGMVLIQDRHSQKVVRKLDVLPGMQVLDACAAPGTKTQQIACLMKNQGKIIATDLYEARCHLIDELMDRTGVSICLLYTSSVLLAIAMVFVVVFITMLYTTRKIRRNNVIEELRIENI